MTMAASTRAPGQERRTEGNSLATLKVFGSLEGLPQTEEEIRQTLQSPLIREVFCCALGPEGTNISQACKLWVESMGIGGKATIELGETPEKCLGMACQADGEGVVAVFWTCAVYFNLNGVFFGWPLTYPLFAEQRMLLDEMQLAVREELFGKIVDGVIPLEWSIASHPSPAPLVRSLSNKVVPVNSNGYAAQMCERGDVELCITTESAREISGLWTVHNFGSPDMVFFAGITGASAEVVKQAYATLLV